MRLEGPASLVHMREEWAGLSNSECSGENLCLGVESISEGSGR